MTQRNRARSRLAVDIGGTFTDVVLDLPDRTLSTKLLTTHAAPDEAVIAGTETILREAGVPASALDLVIHGTTLATNSLIERKGARAALITTAGFRDSLEIAYEHRFEQYDLYMERPEPLIPRDLRLEVPERLAADGSMLLPLDEAALESLLPTLREQRIQALAISFLHAYINPAHEERARALITRAMPELADHHLLGGLPRNPRIRANLHGRRQCLRAADDGALPVAHGGRAPAYRRRRARCC